MRRPTITVAVPAYNAERWIGEALAAVLAQTDPPDEVVVVDDGSTDGTVGEVERFGASVRLVRQANGGCPAAFNRAFAEARGDYVALCPADDVWEPRKLEWQREALAAHPEIDVAFGAARTFGLSEADFRRPPADGLLDRAALTRAMYERNVVADPGAVVRRALHERLGGFRDLIGEDYEFWMRALRAGAVFWYDPRLLVRLRAHGGNLSAQALAIWRTNLRVHREFAPDVRDPALVARALARDVWSVARCRVGLALRAA